MTSEVRYKYYECYIDNADENMLESIKKDIFLDKNANNLYLNHYLKLSRMIIKRKKAIEKIKDTKEIVSQF
jgi:hypothetical protein